MLDLDSLGFNVKVSLMVNLLFGTYSLYFLKTHLSSLEINGALLKYLIFFFFWGVA
jgi:small neutral amino acid transporter SnatA (MarC family)